VFGVESGGHDYLLWKEHQDDSWQQKCWQRATPKMTEAFARVVEECKTLWARLQDEKMQYAWLKVGLSKSLEVGVTFTRRRYQVTRTSPLFKDRVGGKILIHYEGSPSAAVSLNIIKM
jgi:hypothetical protein